MITDEIKFKGALKVDIIRVWNSTKTKFKDINEYDFFNEELSKLHQPTVSRQSELLFAFIKAIKEEFKDENWDYLDFIADRVIGKQ
jgi:hypothetical protein